MAISLSTHDIMNLQNLIQGRDTGGLPGTAATVRLVLGILRRRLGWRALYLCPWALLTSRRPPSLGEPAWMAAAAQKFLFLRALYRVTGRALGPPRAESLAQELLLKLGMVEWLKVLPIDEARHLSPDAFLRLFRDSVKPAMGAHSLDNYEVHANQMTMTVHRCMLVEIFTALGMPELLPCLCQTDQVYLNNLAPDIVFERNGVIAEGAPECRFVFTFRHKATI